MFFFAVLAVASLFFLAMPRRFGGRSPRDAARRGMAFALIFTGLSHLAMPASFEVYFPDWVPFVTPLIYLTGIAEIVGAIGLLVRHYRAMTGIALAAYFLLVFPANIYVAVSGTPESLPGLPDAGWYSWFRLLFQPLFIWWVLRSTQPSGSLIWPRRSPNRFGMAS